AQRAAGRGATARLGLAAAVPARRRVRLRGGMAAPLAQRDAGVHRDARTQAAQPRTAAARGAGGAPTWRRGVDAGDLDAHRRGGGADPVAAHAGAEELRAVATAGERRQ